MLLLCCRTIGFSHCLSSCSKLGKFSFCVSRVLVV
uniref:Uncharacterized protein n=1 Tax=Rhizophora mucronata TaxID=61149 RepID=A0A2P2Q0U9_RHIMU